MTRYYLDDDDMYLKVKSDVGQVPGCYRLYSEHRGGGSIVIDRFMGRDFTGLLYIGGSRSLADRVGALRGNAMSVYKIGGYKSRAHVSGWKMEVIPEFVTRFPWSGLYLQVEAITADRSTELSFRSRERQLLREYRDRFGETPPLNG